MDQITTTVFSTTTATSTKTLTRTVFSVTPFLPASASNLPLNPATIKRPSDESSLYPFDPSLFLSILFTVLYLFATLHHGYLCLYIPSRPETLNKHRYTIPLFIASLLSTIGYLTRCISIQPTYNTTLPLYATSTALILTSPIFICATLYLLLNRLITRCLPSQTVATPITPRATTIAPTATPDRNLNLQKFLFLPPTLLSPLFITSDTLTLLTQILGAAISASNGNKEPQLTAGTHTVLAGLTLQLTTFILYLSTLHTFCTRVRRSSTTGFNPCILRVVTATWIASGFVLVRTVFRLVEFATGAEGYAFGHEWCLYVFEALPVWVAVAVLGWWHPVKWVQERVLAAEVGAVVGRQRLGQGGGVADGGRGTVVVIREPVAGSADGEGHVRRRSRGFGFGL